MASFAMQNPTPLFPEFHLQTLRRKPRSAQQILIDKLHHLKQKTFSQLGECFGKFIPAQSLQPSQSGTLSRRRLFSKENTFWAFFSQILDADGGCQEVIRKIQADAAMQSKPLPSSSTAAYCQARKRFDLSSLNAIFQYTVQQLQRPPDIGLLHGRRVVVVDGTSASMPDTPENQQRWPQQANQKPGCGFPRATLCACFNLHTGGLLSYQVGNKKNHELPLLRQQWSTFESGDIFLGDKGFCSFYDVHSFLRQGVDSVITLARRTPVTAAEAVTVLGKDDLLIRWKKPVHQKASSYSKADWKALPESLLLRQIKVVVNEPGFRVKMFYIVTTLLDAEDYSVDELAALYFQRWDVELFFRDLKTTIGMDILRCRTPEMVHKEIIMHMIVYNCIRGLMNDAATREKVRVRRISFKGCIQALRQWEPYLNQRTMNARERHRMIELLYDSLTKKLIPDRPGRSEPRALKRRPKPFQLLNKPRHEMKEIKHRSRYRAKTP